MDMRYYWIRDRVKQQHFTVKWRPGKSNHADPWSKHHSATVNREIRQRYMVDQPHKLPQHAAGSVDLCYYCVFDSCE